MCVCVSSSGPFRVFRVAVLLARACACVLAPAFCVGLGFFSRVLVATNSNFYGKRVGVAGFRIRLP